MNENADDETGPEDGKPEAFASLIAQFIKDGREGGFCWLSLTDGVQQPLERVVQGAPATVLLRAADARHLACAAENGFTEVYSNDRRFLMRPLSSACAALTLSRKHSNEHESPE